MSLEYFIFFSRIILDYQKLLKLLLFTYFMILSSATIKILQN